MKDLISQGIKIQMCVTSPPYWGLRDYGVEGQLGLEKTPEEYVSNMVEVFRLVKRLLVDDGTLWLNLGDSYAGSGRGRDADGTWNPGKGGSKQETNIGAITGRVVNAKSFSKKAIEAGVTGNAWVKPPYGLKCKDLVGIPWRVAFALQKDGWYLRSDIIWHKPNPMPESVKDRPTKSHEYIFLMAKNPKYYYDAEAIREPWINRENDIKRAIDGNYKYEGKFKDGYDKANSRNNHLNAHATGQPIGNPLTGRNKRSVWTVNTTPYKEAHFATFPPKLIEPCILAGSRTGDIVFDPFFGSGTTGQVASSLGRQWIGIELNLKYEKLQKERTVVIGLTLH